MAATWTLAGSKHGWPSEQAICRHVNFPRSNKKFGANAHKDAVNYGKNEHGRHSGVSPHGRHIPKMVRA